jgi:hypothetical protein
VKNDSTKDKKQTSEKYKIARSPAYQIADYQKDGAGQNQRQSYGVIPLRE